MNTLNYKFAFISGNDISKKDIKKYGCAGLFNDEAKKCLQCLVKEECQKKLNPYFRMAIEEREVIFYEHAAA